MHATTILAVRHKGQVAVAGEVVISVHDEAEQLFAASDNVSEGRRPEVVDSIGRATATAGQAVVFAGGTVIIAIGGLVVAAGESAPREI